MGLAVAIGSLVHVCDEPVGVRTIGIFSVLQRILEAFHAFLLLAGMCSTDSNSPCGDRSHTSRYEWSESKFEYCEHFQLCILR